jgi:hypothetical protein
VPFLTLRVKAEADSLWNGKQIDSRECVGVSWPVARDVTATLFAINIASLTLQKQACYCF